MTYQDLGKKILETIKNKKIVPKPKWTFLLKDYTVWTVGVLSLIIGSLSFSVIIHMSLNNDWDVWRYINDNFLGFVLATLPYLWLILLALFIVLAFYNFQHTKKGYKCRLPFIIISSILISMFSGTLLYTAGVGYKIDEVFAERIPRFHKLFNQRPKIWSQAEKGLLAGLVVSKTEAQLEVIDFNKKPWTVDITESRMAPGAEIIIERPIRLIGKKIDENNFKAWEILTKRPPHFPGPPPLPWPPHPEMKDRLRNNF